MFSFSFRNMLAKQLGNLIIGYANNQKVTELVNHYNSSDLTGAQRKDAVIKDLEGIILDKANINLAIELAVSLLK